MKRTVLIDTASGDRANEPAEPPKLIHPVDAVQFIATGRFHSQPIDPIRSWYLCGEGEDDWLVERESGRVDLASEILTHSIESGRLRCAYVVKVGNKAHRGYPEALRLEVIPSEQFAGAEVTHSWDDGFSLSVVRKREDAPEGEDEEWVENFLLFWDEVSQVSPFCLGDASEGEFVPPAPRPTPHRSLVESRSMVTAHVGGRPTKAPAAHAALTIKLLEASDEEFASFTVESAAVELHGINGAHLDNCRKAARQIVQQVREHRESKS